MGASHTPSSPLLPAPFSLILFYRINWKGNSRSRVAPALALCPGPAVGSTRAESQCRLRLVACRPDACPESGCGAAQDLPPAMEEPSAKPGLPPPWRDSPREPGSTAVPPGRRHGCRWQLPAPAGQDPHFLPGQPLAGAPASKPAVSHAHPAITAVLSGLGITDGCQTQTAVGAARPPPTPGRHHPPR